MVVSCQNFDYVLRMPGNVCGPFTEPAVAIHRPDPLRRIPASFVAVGRPDPSLPKSEFCRSSAARDSLGETCE